MAFVGILSQLKLLFGPLVIQLVWYILKQLFTSVLVKGADIYGGPWVSRHNQISHGTTKYLTAQPNISRHNQKLSRHNQISHGKTKYLTAQPNISRHNQITNRKTKNFHGKIK